MSGNGSYPHDVIARIASRNEKNAADIHAALAALDIDPTIRERWRGMMESRARSGFFLPSNPMEMEAAIAALRKGDEIPDFPRGG